MCQFAFSSAKREVITNINEESRLHMGSCRSLHPVLDRIDAGAGNPHFPGDRGRTLTLAKPAFDLGCVDLRLAAPVSAALLSRVDSLELPFPADGDLELGNALNNIEKFCGRMLAAVDILLQGQNMRACFLQFPDDLDQIGQ